MKAIILAAGKGSRLNKYTENLPKGMLNINGKPIIQHQVETFFENGINEIIIVRGYNADKINIKNVKYYYNENYATTNMVESLFCASEELQGDIIISYADIVFQPSVLESVINFKSDIGVVVDEKWKDYWFMRYGKINFDTESLKMNSNGYITELGVSDPLLNNIDGRYVGLLRFSPKGCEIIKSTYHAAQKKFVGKTWLNGRKFENIFMTDLLQEIINQNNNISAIKIKSGWLEFDTNEDYENFSKWSSDHTLQKLIKL